MGISQTDLMNVLGLTEKELERFLGSYTWVPKLSPVRAEEYLTRCGWTRYTGAHGGWIGPDRVDWSEGRAVEIARMRAALDWLVARGWSVTTGCGSPARDPNAAHSHSPGVGEIKYWGLVNEMRRPGGGYIATKNTWRSALRAELRGTAEQPAASA